MLVIQATVWPHGAAPYSEYGGRFTDLEIVSIIVGNDGTGEPGGPNEGGTGNYDVFIGDPATDNRTKYWKHIGRIEGVPRTPTHRVELIRKALDLFEAAQ